MKKFEDRLIFDEVMGKSLASCFLTHSVLCGSRGFVDDVMFP